MSQVIAIANQKGGVSKTTSTIAVGGLISEHQPCLVVDLDPQGNLTTGLGVQLEEDQLTIYDVLTKRCSAAEAIIETETVYLIPSDIGLAQGEREIGSKFEPHFYLKEQLESLEFPYILIDCPPSLGILTYNALTAATDVLIPVQCEFFSMKGLQQLLETIEAVKQRANPDLNILGILPTMGQRTGMTDDTIANLEALSESDDLQIFDTVPRSINFAYSNLAGKPIHLYAAKEEKLIGPYRQIVSQLMQFAEV